MNILWPVLDLYRGNNQFLGIMTIAGLLESYGHHSEVVDADYRAVADKLQKGDFKIVAFSTMSLYCLSYLRLNRKLKETFPIFSVFGGPHPTYFPEMIHQEGVDGICIGEGEFAMLDLVQKLSAGKPITDIPNWWDRNYGSYVEVRAVGDTGQILLRPRTLYRHSLRGFSLFPGQSLIPATT